MWINVKYFIENAHECQSNGVQKKKEDAYLFGSKQYWLFKSIVLRELNIKDKIKK